MVLDVPARLQAVRAFTQLPEAEALAAANKRIGNILKKTVPETDVVDVALFDSEAEKALYEALCVAEPKAKAHYEAGRYTDLLKGLAPMKAPVDHFFEDVMVNVEDARVRANRLALLWRLHRTMNMVAELSRLAK